MLRFAAAASLLFAVYDVRRGKVPNKGLILFLAAGLALRPVLSGAPQPGSAMIGACGIFLLLWPAYCLGAVGAGDVKLMMALGSFCGWPGSLRLLLMSLGAGGLFAVIRFAVRRDLASRFAYLACYVRELLRGSNPAPYLDGAEGGKVPFAVFAAAGMLAYAALEGGF